MLFSIYTQRVRVFACKSRYAHSDLPKRRHMREKCKWMDASASLEEARSVLLQKRPAVPLDPRSFVAYIIAGTFGAQAIGVHRARIYVRWLGTKKVINLR